MSLPDLTKIDSECYEIITTKRVMNINEYQLHLFPALQTFWFLEKNCVTSKFALVELN